MLQQPPMYQRAVWRGWRSPSPKNSVGRPSRGLVHVHAAALSPNTGFGHEGGGCGHIFWPRLAPLFCSLDVVRPLWISSAKRKTSSCLGRGRPPHWWCFSIGSPAWPCQQHFTADVLEGVSWERREITLLAEDFVQCAAFSESALSSSPTVDEIRRCRKQPLALES